MTKQSNDLPVTLVTKIWKAGESYLIKIPREQKPLFEDWHKNKRQLIVVVATPEFMKNRRLVFVEKDVKIADE